MDGEQALHRTRDAVLSGSGPAPASAPRTTVAASWRRVEACGLEPGSAPEVPPLGSSELERRRAVSGLGEFVPRLTETLSSVIDAGQLVVVADAEGRVLWRAGSSGVRRLADGLGLHRRLGLDRGQRRHQRDRHQPRARRGRAHPGPGALRRVPHPLGLRRGTVAGPLVGPDPRRGGRQRTFPWHAPGRARPGRDGVAADVDGARGASSGAAGPPPRHRRSPARAHRRGRPGRRRATGTSRPPWARGRPTGWRSPTTWPVDPCGCRRWARPWPSPSPAAGCCGSDGEAAGLPSELVLDLTGAPVVRVAGAAGRGRDSSRPATPRSWWRCSRPGPRVVRRPGWRWTCSTTRSGW